MYHTNDHELDFWGVLLILFIIIYIVLHRLGVFHDNIENYFFTVIQRNFIQRNYYIHAVAVESEFLQNLNIL